MNNKKQILVADQLFLAKKNTLSRDFISVFPDTDDSQAYRANYEDLYCRGTAQSMFYKLALPEFTAIIDEIASIGKLESKDLYRPPLVTLVSLFVDRSIRVAYRLHQIDVARLKVAEVESLHEFSRLDELKNMTSNSWHFNQSMTMQIACHLGVEPIKILDRDEYPELPIRPTQPNFTVGSQALNRKHKLAFRILNRSLGYWRRTPSLFARYTSLGLLGDEYDLTRSGLYGLFGVLNSNKTFELQTTSRNPELRNRLRRCLQESVVTAIANLLYTVSQKVIPRDTCERLSHLFPTFFSEYIPVNFLEGLSSNLDAALQHRKKARTQHLIGADFASDESIFLCAATKILGGKVVGVQHGGHYGYIEGLSYFAEFEYAMYDKIITWGWTDFEQCLPATLALPLPSPRLSTKQRNYEKEFLSSSHHIGKKIDILLMTNLVRRFTYITTCGHARIDFLGDTMASQRRLIKGLAEACIRVDHKPYSQSVEDLMAKHLAELNTIGGSNYRLLKSTQKGLTFDLIKNYRVILWDQVGTGTLECLVSKIPTMVFWERVYSRESVYARSLIKDLEGTGVIHSSVQSLITEIERFLADPAGWMHNELRRRAIENFCCRFALTDSNWSRAWRNALS